MPTKEQSQPVDYARAVVALVVDMSMECAAQVYDFVRFLQSQSHALCKVCGLRQHLPHLATVAVTFPNVCRSCRSRYNT